MTDVYQMYIERNGEITPHGFHLGSAVYRAQCETWAIAKRLSGRTGDVSRFADHRSIPFGLRLLPPYRTPEIKAFRKAVADAVRQSRA